MCNSVFVETYKHTSKLGMANTPPRSAAKGVLHDSPDTCIIMLGSINGVVSNDARCLARPPLTCGPNVMVLCTPLTLIMGLFHGTHTPDCGGVCRCNASMLRAVKASACCRRYAAKRALSASTCWARVGLLNACCFVAFCWWLVGGWNRCGRLENTDNPHTYLPQPVVLHSTYSFIVHANVRWEAQAAKPMLLVARVERQPMGTRWQHRTGKSRATLVCRNRVATHGVMTPTFVGSTHAPRWDRHRRGTADGDGRRKEWAGQCGRCPGCGWHRMGAQQHGSIGSHLHELCEQCAVGLHRGCPCADERFLGLALFLCG